MRRLFPLILLLTGCRADPKEDHVAPDPPDDGLLTFNLHLGKFTSGPLAGADQLGFTVDSIEVVHRRRVNGVLQPQETITVATGSIPLWIAVPESNDLRFAGNYWIPPGEIQSVKVNVSDLFSETGTTSTDVYIGTQTPTTSGTLWFNPPTPKPEMPPYGRMGYVGEINAGSGGHITPHGTSAYKIAPVLPGKSVQRYQRFNHAEDQLLVRFDPAASSTTISSFLTATGATEVWTNWTGMRLLRFPGHDWSTISQKLMTYRNSTIVHYATFNPRLTKGGHDPDLLNDPAFQHDNSAWMEDIGVESAWSTQLGSRDVVIAFIDTGIDINHPQLVNNLWVNEAELPDVCGNPFVDTFDLDGDGHFTLNDLNNPTVPADLTDALADLYSCEGITLTPDAWETELDVLDGGLYQGDDLIAAFADGLDSPTDTNTIADDLFGANFAFSTPDSTAPGGCTMGATNDVDPSGEGLVEPHGTQMAGLVAAARDDGFNTAGIMDEVRILELRLEDSCSGANASDFEEALDYLDEFGPDIVVMEFGHNTEDTEEKASATIEETTVLFEMYPSTLFILLAHNYGNDCDDPSMVCWPAENEADNAITVMSTETVATDPERVATGRWSDPFPTDPQFLASSFGDETVDIAVPGYVIHNSTGALIDPMMYSLAHRDQYAGFVAYADYHKDATGATSAAIAIAGGVAGLVLSDCPAVTGDGAALATILLDGADTTRGIFVTGEVDGNRYLSATGALAVSCPP